MAYIPIILTVVSLCFLGQFAALRANGGKTTKSESNFHSSIARIQSSARIQADIILLGSSRIARLPEFRANGTTVSNLGCDGGSAMITLRAIDRGLLPLSAVVVVEGNTLLHDLDHRGRDIGEAIESRWFQLGMVFPGVSSTARPSAFAYSSLLGRGRAAEFNREGPLLSPGASLEYTGRAMGLSPAGESLVKELAGLLGRLKGKGSKVMIVMLPPSAPQESPNYAIPCEVARVCNIPLLDLTRDLSPDAVEYTDGVHMAPASASAALRSIITEVESL